MITENARYLIDYQWRRSSSFEGRATQLLATSAVVLTLAAGLLTQRVGRFELAVFLLLGAGAFSLLVAAVCSVMCLAPRDAQGPNVEQFRETLYFGYRGGSSPPDLLDEQIASMYIGGPDLPAGHQPLLASLAADADRRGRWLSRCVWWFVASLGPLSAAVVVILAGR